MLILWTWHFFVLEDLTVKLNFLCLIDIRQKRLVFQVFTAKMNLSDEVDLEDYVSRPDKISGAEIAAIWLEGSLHAVRQNRCVILAKDFEKGYGSNVKKPDTDFNFTKNRSCRIIRICITSNIIFCSYGLCNVWAFDGPNSA